MTKQSSLKKALSQVTPEQAEKFCENLFNSKLYGTLIRAAVSAKENTPDAAISVDDYIQEIVLHTMSASLPKVNEFGDDWIPYIKESARNCIINMNVRKFAKKRKHIKVSYEELVNCECDNISGGNSASKDLKKLGTTFETPEDYLIYAETIKRVRKKLNNKIKRGIFTSMLLETSDIYKNGKVSYIKIAEKFRIKNHLASKYLREIKQCLIYEIYADPS